MSKQFFWPKILIINPLGVNVHKTYINAYVLMQKQSALLQYKKFFKAKFLGILGH
jgi:hypothetical protein